jgi:hypothetical protein
MLDRARPGHRRQRAAKQRLALKRGIGKSGSDLGQIQYH